MTITIVYKISRNSIGVSEGEEDFEKLVCACIADEIEERLALFEGVEFAVVVSMTNQGQDTLEIEYGVASEKNIQEHTIRKEVWEASDLGYEKACRVRQQRLR